MTGRLQRLIARARLAKMTAADWAAQRISFAYGNVAMENPNVTREMVESVAREMEEDR